MIKKITLGGNTLDDFLHYRYKANNQELSRHKRHYFKLPVCFKEINELQEICGKDLKNMWTGCTSSMTRSMKANEPMEVGAAEYIGDIDVNTFVVICQDGLAWDSRVFNVSTQANMYDKSNLLIKDNV